MKDTIWVFQSFGFRVGMQFIYDTLSLRLHRLWTGTSVPSFDSLTDKEIEKLAEAYAPEPEAKIVYSYKDTLN